MEMRTAHDIGLCIRASRRRQHLTQARLAERIGTSQKWVSAVENGSGTSEIGAVLRCLRALGVQLSAQDAEPRRQASAMGIDLESVLGELQGYRRGPVE